MTMKTDSKSHISPERLPRFMDDDDSVAYQEIIPGPESKRIKTDEDHKKDSRSDDDNV